jgi:inosine-uridine nucleoside N-ribohydrolase
MKITASIIILAALITAGCSGKKSPDTSMAVKIIFDTDLGPDYDDVGALAILHAMADSGKAEILATMASNKDELVAPCIEIINTYFGRPEIPIGAPKSPGVNLTAWQHWPDSLVAEYNHTIRSTDDAPDAVLLYRKILASQPDSSVTIVTVGFMTNLANLLKSQPDSISPLNGQELVSLKVKGYVAMAGRFPEGKEFNVEKDSVASEYVFNEWPGKIIFTGFEIGSKLFTGLRLVSSKIENSPVKDVFRISLPLSEEDRNGRMSWDETAVIIAVYGPDKFFSLKHGNIIVAPDGSNTWQDDQNGRHAYVEWKMDKKELEKFLEDRMMHIPVKKQ